MTAPPVTPEPDTDQADTEAPTRPRQRLGLDRLRGGRWAMWITRLLVWAVLALAALGALRLVAEPPVEQIVNQTLASQGGEDSPVDEHEAAALAERMTRDYLHYNPEGADGSDRWHHHLSDEQSITGWRGTQPVIPHDVSAVTVERTGEHRLLVTVAALARTGRQEPEWHHLAVPVVSDDEGRLAVVGSPALTGPPDRPTVDGREAPETDTELTRRLRDDVEEFLAAYGRGGQAAVDAFTAPGEQLTALPDQARLDELVNLAVHDGEDGRRTATATVRWRLHAGKEDDAADREAINEPAREPADEAAMVTQPYRLVLTRSGDRWLVADIAPSPAVTR